MMQQWISIRKLGGALLGCAFAACLAQPAIAELCAGDCGEDGAVTVGEIVTCVNIALGMQTVDTCSNCDPSSDDVVTVDEFIRAVNVALDICPVVPPTPTPTPTGGPSECPTPPATPHGSIIVWPDLRVDGSHDPVVQLKNTSQILAVASCFYADAGPHCAGSGAPCATDAECGGDTCAPVCDVERFTVRLPMLSTLSWQPRQEGIDEFGDPIPAVSTISFHGELVCVEVDAGGSPFPGNHLAGSFEQAPQCPVPATSVAGFETSDGDAVLCLDGEPSDQCPLGAEYGGCPTSVDPIRIEGCWSHSAFTLDCGPSVTAPTSTPTRTPPPGSTPTRTACPQAARGSVVVFEELSVNTTSDPVLELRNVANFRIHAQCFYADAGAGPGCVVSEFSVSLAKQSSVTWQPRLGGADAFGNSIPALPTMPFQGELVCVQVDEYGTPLPADSLSGSVTAAGACSVVATAVRGNPDIPADDTVLCLSGSVSVQCPNGAEYGSCPASVGAARIAGCWSQSRFTFVCG